MNDASDKKSQSKNVLFADLDRLKLAGGVFAYLAWLVYSLEKAEEAGLAWRASAAAAPPWPAGMASWTPSPSPGPRASRPPTSCPEVSWEGLEVVGEMEAGFLVVLLTACQGGGREAPDCLLAVSL